MRTSLVIAVVGLVLVTGYLCVFTVDAGEYAYATVFGRHVATYDGGAGGAGLHVGWPWPIQSVQRLDRRLQQFDLPATEHLTPDKEKRTVDKNLSIEAYVVWRIDDAEAVDTFIRRIGTADRARQILGSRIISRLGATLGTMNMDDIVNVEPGRVDREMARWQKALVAELVEPLRQEYGIELVDIRLRRFNYPGQTRNAIFARIKSERDTKVTEYQVEGERQARNIESTAEEKYRNILAQARFEEEQLKGKAEAEAMRIRNQAHSQDPEFYAFLKKMEKLQAILAENRTVLLMSTQRPLFDLLFQPPQPTGGGTAPPSKPAPPQVSESAPKKGGD